MKCTCKANNLTILHFFFIMFGYLHSQCNVFFSCKNHVGLVAKRKFEVCPARIMFFFLTQCNPKNTYRAYQKTMAIRNYLVILLQWRNKAWITFIVVRSQQDCDDHTRIAMITPGSRQSHQDRDDGSRITTIAAGYSEMK